MVEYTLYNSILVNGDIKKVFEVLKNSIIEMSYKTITVEEPFYMEVQRGKGGLLTTKIKDSKTNLKISLKEAPKGDVISILFDYKFNLKGLFTEKDKDFIQSELVKINHDLFDIGSSGKPKFLRDYSKLNK